MWHRGASERWVSDSRGRWNIWSEHSIFYLISTKPVIYTRVLFRKSTFFNVLTKSAAAAENFPFCTIGQYKLISFDFVEQTVICNNTILDRNALSIGPFFPNRQGTSVKSQLSWKDWRNCYHNLSTLWPLKVTNIKFLLTISSLIHTLRSRE